MWGTVGSGLTPGTPLGRRTSEIPDPEPENPEKTGKTVSRPFRSTTAEPRHQVLEFGLIWAEPRHLQTW